MAKIPSDPKTKKRATRRKGGRSSWIPGTKALRRLAASLPLTALLVEEVRAAKRAEEEWQKSPASPEESPAAAGNPEALDAAQLPADASWAEPAASLESDSPPEPPGMAAPAVEHAAWDGLQPMVNADGAFSIAAAIESNPQPPEPAIAGHLLALDQTAQSGVDSTPPTGPESTTLPPPEVATVSMGFDPATLALLLGGAAAATGLSGGGGHSTGTSGGSGGSGGSTNPTGSGGSGGSTNPTGSGGSGGSGGSVPPPPHPGFVADGYISGATIYKVDAQGNEIKHADGSLWRTTSKSDGSFDLNALPSTGSLVATGGTDTSTGLPSTITLIAPAGSSAINPLTTLVQTFVQNNPGMTPQEAASAVATALGIPAGVDLLTFDPIKAASSGTGASAADALSVEVKAAQIANLLVTGSQALAAGGAMDVQAATSKLLSNLVSVISSEPAGHTSLNLADVSTITAVLGSASADVVSLIAAGNNISATSLSSLYDEQKVVQGTIATAIGAGAVDTNALQGFTSLLTASASGEKVITVHLSPGSDSGVSASDAITNIANPSIRLTLSDIASSLAAGDQVTLKLNGVQVYQGTLSSGDITQGFVDVKLDNVGADGAKSVSVVIHDAVKGDVATGLTAFNLETAAPPTPTVTGLVMNTDGSATLTGTYSGDVGLTLVVNDSPFKPVLDQGHWSVTLSKSDLGSIAGNTQSLNISLTATDLAGNQSELKTSEAIGSSPPPIPVPPPGPGSDSSSGSSDSSSGSSESSSGSSESSSGSSESSSGSSESSSGSSESSSGSSESSSGSSESSSGSSESSSGSSESSSGSSESSSGSSESSSGSSESSSGSSESSSGSSESSSGSSESSSGSSESSSGSSESSSGSSESSSGSSESSSGSRDSS
jgi:hypothetical protein